MSTTQQEVIDLTGDGNAQLGNTPPSRRQQRMAELRPASQLIRTPTPLSQDIISLDDHDDPAGIHLNAASPELEFMFARTLLPTTMPYPRPRAIGPPRIGSASVGGSSSRSPSLFSLSNVGRTGAGGPSSWAQWRTVGQSSRQFQAAARPEEHHPQRNNHQQEARPRVPNGRIHTQFVEDLLHNRDPMFMNANPNMDLPDQLNFVAQGFAMSSGGGQAAENARARAPPPAYDPPSPPRTGYTRSPREEDILLCPNCGEELGVGKDDIKKQVWVIKRCGHVSLTFYSFFTRLKANWILGLLRGMYEASAESRKTEGAAP